MTYYADRMNAYQIIDKMVLDGSSEDLIVYKISTAYGFGRKFVKDRIDLIHTTAKLSTSNKKRKDEKTKQAENEFKEIMANAGVIKE